VIVQALKPHRNWYLDLANERDVRDARYVSPVELKELRELVRRLDPPRLVTASFGGHDLSDQDVRESLLTIGLDFLAPHRVAPPIFRSKGDVQRPFVRKIVGVAQPREDCILLLVTR
jgi:hypothetical protein